MLALAGLLLASGVVAAILTRPRGNADAPLREARALVEQSRFKAAADLINEQFLPFVARGQATPQQEQEALRLRAHAIFQGQRLADEDLPANYAAVTEDYARAESLGAALSPFEQFEDGWSLAGLGRLEPAARRARSIPDSERPMRHLLVRRIVEKGLAESGGTSSLALDLLTDLLSEPALAETERSWGIARQAELLLAAGHADDAVDRLLREMQRVQDAPRSRRAEMHYLLGRAYHQSGRVAMALSQLQVADSLLEAADPLRAEIGVMVGRILKDSPGQLERAKERFAEVIGDFARSPAYPAALFGLAECLAKEGLDEPAAEMFARVVGELSRGVQRADMTPAIVRASLIAHAQNREQAEDYERAIAYATLAEQIDPPGAAPPDVLRAVASARKKRALALLRAAGATDAAAARLNEVDRQQVKRLLLGAGRYFREHARGTSDPATFAESLWEAADAFDRAGDAEEAARAFADYVERATDNDPRRPEARFRLAQVLQSTREYASAADHYRQLLQSRAASGPWAIRSIVPLAQCLLRDADPDNDAEAERLLLGAVDGSELAPEAEEFRAGLVELGRLLYETKRYEEAIRRITEALDRYPADPSADLLRYRLADCYRLSAARLEQELSGAEGAIPESERLDKDAARRDRLRRALALYEQVRQALDARDPSSLSPLEQVQHRNTCFYLGDCAYDLGDYPAAISAYDAARQRYPNEPASLVAMVQIVNAYVQQGEWAKARVANEAAKRHLARLPHEAWASPDMPMERRHWERWLNSSTLLDQHASAAGPEGR
jgi:tetratricopeptide (TPR) repeat protein